MGLIRLLVCACLFPVLTFASEHIEVYGDSISAGFLSRTRVTAAPPLSEVGVTISNLAMYLMDREKNKHYVDKEHAPDLAWPALVAKEIDPAGPVKLYNNAVSSSRAWEMAGQVRSNKAPAGKTRAFFFIGHNDLCNNLDTPKNIAAAFGNEMDDALRLWDAAHSDSVAYLVPVADIHRVYKALDGFIWHRGTKKNYTCMDSWTKFFPYCASHYAKFKVGALDTYMVPRLDAMNDMLDARALAWSKKSTKNRFVYLKNAHDTPYLKEFFAVDCFHMSPEGQRQIADRVLEMLRKFEMP